MWLQHRLLHFGSFVKKHSSRFYTLYNKGVFSYSYHLNSLSFSPNSLQLIGNHHLPIFLPLSSSKVKSLLFPCKSNAIAPQSQCFLLPIATLSQCTCILCLFKVVSVSLNSAALFLVRYFYILKWHFWDLSIDMGIFWGSWFLHNHEIPHPNQWGSMITTKKYCLFNEDFSVVGFICI